MRAPLAENEVHAALLEPKGTAHTGTANSEKTVNDRQWIETNGTSLGRLTLHYKAIGSIP